MGKNLVAKHNRNKGGVHKPKKGKGAYVREKPSETTKKGKRRQAT